jgi:hypothetical protein
MTGMTEMTKKMKSRTREELPEVYRLAVILVICVIFKADDISQLANLKRRRQWLLRKYECKSEKHNADDNCNGLFDPN